MRVHDLAGHGHPNSTMAGDASILPVGSQIGKMPLTIGVAADAEVCPLDGAETEAVVIVVTRCAQATAHVPG